MSLRHAVLGLLAVEPATGYELTRKFERSLGHAWHASHSQIYPELARLAEANLVEVIGHGARRSKTYGITQTGRAELRHWLVESRPDRSKRDESGLRLFLTPLLDPADRRATFERDLADVNHELDTLYDLRTELQGTGSPQTFAPQVELGIRINDVLRDWLREQIEATPDNHGPG